MIARIGESVPGPADSLNHQRNEVVPCKDLSGVIDSVKQVVMPRLKQFSAQQKIDAVPLSAAR